MSLNSIGFSGDSSKNAQVVLPPIPPSITPSAIRRLARATGRTVAEAEIDIRAELLLGTPAKSVCGKIVNEFNGFSWVRTKTISIEGDFESPDEADAFVARHAIDRGDEEEDPVPDAAVPAGGFLTASELAEIANLTPDSIWDRTEVLSERIGSAKADSLGLGDEAERIALARKALAALRASPSGRGRPKKVLSARRKGRDGK